MIKKIALLALMCLGMIDLSAKAPKWMANCTSAVLELTTYTDKGAILHRGNAFFINEKGEALSAFSYFDGASRATVTDAKGKAYEVQVICGVDATYDVIRFQVKDGSKIKFIPLSDAVEAGTKAYLIHKTLVEGKVIDVSLIKGDYNYYHLAFPLTPLQANLPIVTAEGKVLGLAQTDASGGKTTSYAVSARYVNSLSFTTKDIFSDWYKSLKIKKAWPADPSQAETLLLLLSGQQNDVTYMQTLDDFIVTFPSDATGYSQRASFYADKALRDKEKQKDWLTKAEADFDKALDLSDVKSEALFSQAKTYYNYAMRDTTAGGRWTFANAAELMTKAIAEDPKVAYQQLLGDIYIVQENYPEAYKAYTFVCHSSTAAPASFYRLSQIKQKLPNVNIGEMIALMDSAIARFGPNPSMESIPYYMERYRWKLRLLQYDSALQDLEKVISLNPADADHLAEQASVYILTKNYEAALSRIQKAILLNADDASYYRLKGFCLIHLEKKDEACVALHKAMELGDTIAEKLIKTNCK